MKIRYDEQVDALYIRLVDDAAIAESEEVRPGIVLDLDDANEVVGIEVLKVSRRVPADELKKVRSGM